MKLSILQENLTLVVNQVSRALSTKPQLPVLSGIHFNIESDHECVVSATDLYIGIQSRAPIKIQKSSEYKSWVIPGKELKELVSTLNPGTVEIECTENTIIITSGSITATLQKLVAEEYPAFPEINGQEYVTPHGAKDLLQKIVIPSASKDVTRPVLTSVLVSYGEKNVTFVATDSYRLSTVTVPTDTVTQPSEYLIPASAFAEVLSLVTKSQSTTPLTMTFSKEQQQVFVQHENVRIFIRHLEGTYPPYKKIIPESFNTEASIDREEFLSHLKKAQIFARNEGNIVHLKIVDQKLTITANSPTFGAFQATCDQATISGDDVTVACNARYLLEIAQSYQSKQLFFGLVDSLRPMVCKPVDQDSYDILTVIMPFKVHAATS